MRLSARWCLSFAGNWKGRTPSRYHLEMTQAIMWWQIALLLLLRSMGLVMQRGYQRILKWFRIVSTSASMSGKINHFLYGKSLLSKTGFRKTDGSGVLTR